MQRTDRTREPLIELGRASTATQGPIGDTIEVSGLMRRVPFDGR